MVVSQFVPRKEGGPYRWSTRSAGRTSAPPRLATVPDTPAVEIRALVKRYAGRAVVDGLDLVADAGRITAVLGPNGAGKTTTIECCEGLRAPDGGTVRVLGLDPHTAGRVLRPRVGVMLQDGGLPTGVGALEMLRHIASMYDHPRDVPDLTERLGLASFARTTVRRLSGGQRQRLALAIALVGRPELVFLDEPSAGMDPQARHAVWDLVRELRGEGVAVVLTTHLMDEAESLADRVVVVDHGAVIAHGTVAELLAADDDRTLRFQAVEGLDLDSLATRLSAAAGSPGRPVTVQSEGPGEYAASGHVDPGALAALTAWCAERGVLATRITVGRRTLEDVFLDLTGRSLR
jgi:ABC-2 type transport system ATP-binding protein